ncbi:hypothetical protein PN441_09365 [Spirulina major CS-329]|uniref:hypothetical protein n=1 Tax=Spirulina TaxID=1154 RepID=UPI00232D8E01|nr:MULTISPECIES: hypothetical protein [Spirulina]MDB9494003.1 hypothetical protein [Spirulina subsalsa CS-330]MDB9503279.1 hypothetical protein [Spirulina major CS-329]
MSLFVLITLSETGAIAPQHRDSTGSSIFAAEYGDATINGSDCTVVLTVNH